MTDEDEFNEDDIYDNVVIADIEEFDDNTPGEVEIIELDMDIPS